MRVHPALPIGFQIYKSSNRRTVSCDLVDDRRNGVGSAHVAVIGIVQRWTAIGGPRVWDYDDKYQA